MQSELMQQTAPKTPGALSSRPADAPRVAFYTFGCRLNQSESASLASAFSHAGYRVVQDAPAEMAVIQTCSVTETAEADCRRLIRKILRDAPQTFITVTGCYAQVGVEALRRIPGVDLIVGTEYKMDLPDRVREAVGGGRMTKRIVPLVFHTPRIGRNDFTVDHYAAFDHATRPNIKIQDGCDFFCAFCIIPYTRGRERSRTMSDVLLEASVWAAQGKREIVLTGVNLGNYRSDGCDLVDLIDALSEIPGLHRIRISSIEPTTVSRRLIDRMAESDGKLCPYLHLPLQSGSNAILSAMGRKYTREAYVEFVSEAIAVIPHLGLGTDVMVGFPGEGEAEFEETRKLLQALPFSYLHVFPFSARKGTRVTKMAMPPVPAAKIRQRAAILRDLSHRMRRSFYLRHVGQTVSVLFEQRDAEGRWIGLTPNYIRVGVISDDNRFGQVDSVHRDRGILPMPAASEDPLSGQLRSVVIESVEAGLAIGRLV